MTDEDIRKALECCSCDTTRCICNECPIRYRESCLDDLPEIALDLINRQQERIEELEIITGLANKRKYYRKFVDDIFRKQEGNELSEPDFDYIYQLYFEQQTEIEKFKKAIKEADQHFSEGAPHHGMAVIATLAIELEKDGAE